MAARRPPTPPWVTTPTWPRTPPPYRSAEQPPPPPPAPLTWPPWSASRHARDDALLWRVRAGGWAPPPAPPPPPPAPSSAAGPGAAPAPTTGVLYDLTPMLWTLRLVLILPVSYGSYDGRAPRFRWLSWPMLLTVALWLALGANTLASIRFRMAPILEADRHFHLWDLVPRYSMSLGMSFVFLMPFTCWATAPTAVALIEQWLQLEALVAEVSGPVQLVGLRARAWAFSGVCLLLPVVLELCALAALPEIHAWMLPSLIHTIAFFLATTCFWHVTCGALADYSQRLAARIPADLQRLGPQEGLRAHHQIWLDLAQLLRLLGASWGRLQTMLVMLLFVSNVAISFVMVHYLVAGKLNKRFFWMVPFSLLVQIAIATLCNSAQIATDGVRDPAVRQLIAMSFEYKDDSTCIEIVRFLDDIQLEKPELTACRLGVLNRATILSFFSLSCTYLVVLSQFTVSSESSTTDFDTLEVSIDN